MKREIRAQTPRLRPLVACVALALALSSAPSAGNDRGRAALDRDASVAWRADALAFLDAQGSRTHSTSPHAPNGSVLVTSCDDDGPGTLRQAYRNAVTGDNIDLTQLTCSTITLTSGALEDSPTAAEVTLQGPGKYLLTVDGGNADRVLIHRGGDTLHISGMTIKNGSYTGVYGGGCIYSETNVELFDTLVTGCSKHGTGADTAFGGAVYARRAAAMFASQIRDNHVDADSANSAGAGVWADAVNVSASTISGNTASSADGTHYARGGGVFSLTETEISYATITDNEAISGAGVFLVGAAAYTMRIRNSTISGNRASGAGGGVYAKYQPFAVANSTIAENTAGAQYGAGLFLAYATELESTIVANNTSQNGTFESDIGSPYAIAITGANNLVLASNLPLPADTIAQDPMLGPLQDNGGSTMTHALLPGSPAIDHGNNINGYQFDQRLFVLDTSQPYERVVGPAADIGAFESGAPDRVFVDGFDAESL